MALDKTTLKTKIVNILTDMENRTENSKNEFADRLSTAIDDYIKQMTITYSTGLVAPSGGGPVTGVFNATIS